VRATQNRTRVKDEQKLVTGDVSGWMICRTRWSALHYQKNAQKKSEYIPEHMNYFLPLRFLVAAAVAVFFWPFLPRFGMTGLLETDSTSLSELSPSPSTSNSSDFRFLTLSDAARTSAFGGGTDAKAGVEDEVLQANCSAGLTGRGLGTDFCCGKVGSSSGGGEVAGVEGTTVEMSGSKGGSTSTGVETEAAD